MVPTSNDAGGCRPYRIGHSVAGYCLYHAITIWLGRFEREKPGLTLLRLADEWADERADERGDEALRVQAERLQSCLATDSTGEWRGRELAELLVQLRNDSKKKLDVADVLHPLNPH